MRDLIQNVKRRFKELSDQLTDPELLKDRSVYTQISKELAELRQVIQKIDEYERSQHDLEEAEKIIGEAEDQELVHLARSEKQSLEISIPRLEREILTLLAPKDADELKKLKGKGR